MVSKFRGKDNFDTSFATAIAIIADVKPPGTQGGSSVVGNQTRDLNTELTDEQGIVSVDANTGEFTLGAGKYFIKWSAPAFQAARHQASLFNSSGLVREGTSAVASSSGVSFSRSFGSGIVSVASSETFYIQHYTQNVQASDGLGTVSGSGNNEVYTMVEIHKIGL